MKHSFISLCLLFFSLLFALPIHAQKAPSTIESVKPLVDELLRKQSDMNEIDYIEADETNAHEVFRIAKQGGYEEGMFDALRILWRGALYRTKYRGAMEYVAQMEELTLTQTNPFYKSLWYQIRGITLHRIGYNTLAKKDLWSAIDEEKKVVYGVDDPECSHLRFFNYVSLAVLYLDELDRNETFQLYLDEIEKCYQEYNLGGISTLYYAYLKTEWALHLNDWEMGNHYVQLLQETLRQNNNFDNPQFYNTIIRYYQKIDDDEEAYQAMTMAIDRTSHSGVRHHLPELYKIISEQYERRGQTDSALIYHQYYVDLEKRQMQLKLDTSEAIVEVVYDMLEERPEANHYKQYLIITLLSALFAVTLLLVLLYKKRTPQVIATPEQETVIGELNPASVLLTQMAREGNSDFMQHFETVHHRFWHNLNEVHPDLTPSEQELCALTYINFRTQEIADYADVQLRSIQTRRSRLRKKLDIDSNIDLRDYLLEFEN